MRQRPLTGPAVTVAVTGALFRLLKNRLEWDHTRRRSSPLVQSQGYVRMGLSDANVLGTVPPPELTSMPSVGVERGLKEAGAIVC